MENSNPEKQDTGSRDTNSGQLRASSDAELVPFVPSQAEAQPITVVPRRERLEATLQLVAQQLCEKRG